MLRGVCTTRGKRSSAGNGRWPLLWRRSRRLVAVVVVDDDFSFSVAEATKYKHTTRRIATVACFSRITPAEHAYEWSLIFTGPALVILNAKTGHVRRTFFVGNLYIVQLAALLDFRSIIESYNTENTFVEQSSWLLIETKKRDPVVLLDIFLI